MFAEFEEKEYEIAMLAEIVGEALGPVFSPGQVLEKALGFDLAVHLGIHSPLWRILRVPRPPGIVLVPALWYQHERPPAHRLPQSPKSLIFQYKRPEYLHGPQAKQWKRWHAPYFRFQRTADQHQRLRRLERRMGERAVVRYAAPAFWTTPALEAFQLAGEVAAQSGYVSPLRLGEHRVWTYREPGGIGYRNPSVRAEDFDGLDALRDLLVESRTAALVPVGDERAALVEHVLELGSAAESREPRLRSALNEWQRFLAEPSVRLDASDIEVVRAFGAIVSLTYSMGASWHLAAVG